jgi:hypothetical protein
MSDRRNPVYVESQVPVPICPGSSQISVGTRHPYGWGRWRYSINSTRAEIKMDANGVLNHTSTTDNRMPGQLTPNLQCF